MWRFFLSLIGGTDPRRCPECRDTDPEHIAAVRGVDGFCGNAVFGICYTDKEKPLTRAGRVLWQFRHQSTARRLARPRLAQRAFLYRFIRHRAASPHGRLRHTHVAMTTALWTSVAHGETLTS